MTFKAPVARCAALASLLFAATLSAQTPVATTAQPPRAAAMPGGVALSPDGATVAWTLRQREGTTLHLTSVADPDPGKEKLITPNGATNCSNASPMWSPDGATLAFLSTCTGTQDRPGQEQIFLWSKATGEVKQLTHVVGNIAQPAWSPDGKSIAFLFVENASRSAGALDAMKPWAGVIGEDGVEVQRVYGVQVADGKGGWLTPANLHVYEFSWKPGSQQIAFIAAPPPGENTWWIAKLYSTDLCNFYVHLNSDITRNTCRTPDAPHVVLDPQTVAGPLHGLQIAVPRYSPDGTKIAFIGGLMSDQGSTGGDVWVAPSTGGEPVDITPGIDGTPCFEAWLNDKEIGFVEDRRGHSLLVDYDAVAHTEIAHTDLGEVSVSGGAIKDAVSIALKSKGAYLAFVESGFSQPAEVVTVDQDNNVHPLTHLNAGAKPGPKVVSLEYENEGFHVQGWLTFPADYDPAKKYPLIVTVHGGPSADAGPGRGGGMWAQHGYFEFQPNPRGSFGQGEAFVQANVKDFGYGDLRDILKGMDVIEATYPIDKDREGLTGWSYGGFMTMFAVTQTHRFRAAVAGAGISDWQSYYGENSIDQWMIPFFGKSVYDDPAVYAKSSAITFIHQAKTPMLIIVGDRDGECPAPQSFEMWHALREEGVKTQLVVYPNEGHGFRNPEHIRDRNEREVKWFAENMPAK
jgi:dipeptidyl aminopeptidase/acylaminoacyl peptidase